MKLRAFLFLWVVVIVHHTTFGQVEPSLTNKQLRLLDSIACQDVPKSAPGIATAIIRDGKVIYQKVAGYANLKDSTQIDPKTRFNIASNGKQFTALAILVLEDNKKLKLTDDIRTYLPNVLPKYPNKLTIENLLNHSSGIRDVYDLWSLQGKTWWKKSFNNKDALKLIEQQRDLNFEPGTKYKYSNTNYILLALIIEKVTGKSFVKYTKELFTQLNMPDTAFEDDYTTIEEPIAKAYFNFSTWKNYNWIWNVCGDGNLFSTLEDQIAWESLLQNKNNSVIKREIIEKSQTLTNNTKIKNYGYGLEFGDYKGLNYKFHEGATGAWKATTIRFPEQNIAMITLTNTGKATPNTQTRQMADVLLKLKESSKYFATKPSEVGPFVSDESLLGIYATEENFTFQFVKKDTALYLKRIGRNDVLLERENDNTLHQTYDADFKQEFTQNAQGEMEVTAYYTSHAPYKLKKSTSDFSKFDFKSINGTFINTETKALIKIQFTDEKNYKVKIGSQKNLNGILLSTTKLLVENYVLEFVNTNTSVETLFLSGDRIQNVKFERIK
ncbi:serine hydrolase domain-containing protein [Flavobacterium sp.]|uniref:serine hydrolase domain-containing protein n=1 Tax=Flavobacterium sp. TaxID=239 RepID=UPI00261A7C40|nr:serine hydrolase domain-containing protein [Flavobacterium sp.]